MLSFPNVFIGDPIPFNWIPNKAVPACLKQVTFGNDPLGPVIARGETVLCQVKRYKVCHDILYTLSL